MDVRAYYGVAMTNNGLLLLSPYRAPLCGACLCAAPLGVGWCRHFGVGVAMLLSGPRLSGFDSALCVRSRRKRGVGPGNGYALPGHYMRSILTPHGIRVH